MIKKLLLVLSFIAVTTFANAADKTLEELDNYWRAMEQTVVDGEFEKYAAAYHPDAILVSGFSNNSYLIGKAFQRWEQWFDDTKAGKVKAGVQFIWTDRKVSENTAYETGLFNYFSTDKNGEPQHFIAHIEALLVKKQGKWLMMMEKQTKKASQQEWDNAVKQHSK